MSADVSEQKPASGPTFEELIDDLLQAHTDYERAESWQVRRAREDYLVEKVKVVTVLQLLSEQRAVLLEAAREASFLIDEITDLEGREGMSDYDFAEQVISLAHSKREQIRAAINKATGSTP